MVWAEQIALGELGLMPWEFWHLTPHEFHVKVAGFFRREDRAWQKLAVLGGWVLAPYTPQGKQHHLKTDRLLGRSLTVFPRPTQGE